MAGQVRRSADTCSLEFFRHPCFEFLLVTGTNLHRRMPGHIGKFRRRSQEAAAFPFRVPCSNRYLAEDCLHLVRQITFGLPKPFPELIEVGLIT